MVTMNNRDVSSFLLRGLLLALLAATTMATVSKGMTKKMSSKKGMMRMKMKMSAKSSSSVCDPVDLTHDSSSSASFELICTGSTGGARLTDMTGYAIRRSSPDANMLQLDGGTQMQGLEIAAACGHFDDLQGVDIHIMSDFEKAQVAWQRIVGQTVSHPHMDHVADFITMSQELPFGGNYPVYARETVLQDLETHVFNFRIWPDFFNIGFSPNDNTLVRAPLAPFTPVLVPNLGLLLTAFPLNHENPGGSTAFMVEDPDSGAAFLSIFDTGPDSILTGDELRAIWDYVAPLYNDGRLKGVMMESSFITELADTSLFGHLTPCYILQELRSLADAAGVADLEGFNVLVMHIKWKVLDQDYIQTVRNEFELDYLDNLQGTCSEANDLKVKFTFVEQGARYSL